MDFKSIVFVALSLLSVLSVNSCSPIEPNSEKPMITEKEVTTESVPITTTVETTKPNMTTDKTTTIPTTIGGEAQHRVARHQTNKPNDKMEGKPHPIEEPDVSDQNIHEIKVEDQSSKGTDGSTEDLNTSSSTDSEK